jgi:hypothetical protein
MNPLSVTLFFLALSLLAITTVGQSMAQRKCDFMQVAVDYIAKEYPSFDGSKLKPVVFERGDLWELSYELPPGTLGGTPIITIDKRTCKVVKAIHEQ